MTAARIPELQRSIDGMAVPGIFVDHRVIAHGDEFSLLPDELDAFVTSVEKVRRASGAARIVARELLLRLGQQQQAIPKSASGMPIWPSGIVGSLAHESEIAVAALAMRRDYSSLGVDVEPAQALEPDDLKIIATATERQMIRSGDVCYSRSKKRSIRPSTRSTVCSWIIMMLRCLCLQAQRQCAVGELSVSDIVLPGTLSCWLSFQRCQPPL